MARPTNKKELLEQSVAAYEALISYIEQMPKSLQLSNFPEGTLNRNIRDVLGHLHAWHLLFLEWYTLGMSNQQPKMPAEGYTWKTVPKLNQQIQQRYKEVGLVDIKSLLQQSYKVVIKIVETHSNEDLFTKKKYAWTGNTSLGSYLISATYSHYAWAYKLIKKAKKEEAKT